MDEAQLVTQVTHSTGAIDPNVVRTAIIAVARDLGTHLPRALATRVSERVPAVFGSALTSSTATAGASLETMYGRVGELTGLRMSQAVELAQAAVQNLGLALGETLRQAVRGHLPSDWSALLAEPETSPEAPPHTRAAVPAEPPADAPQTLASGRPGSRRPLASARPAEAHRHSIAASDDPHADTKLASAEGTRSDQRDDTLARGKPGSEHPLSDADEDT